MKEPIFQIEEINDPVEVARCKAQDKRGMRNSDWLQAHGPTCCPKREASSSPWPARKPSSPTHTRRPGQWLVADPEDDGELSQYVFPGKGPRSYACRWRVAGL